MRTVVAGGIAVVWIVGLVGLSSWIWVRSRRVGLDAKRAAEHRRIVQDRRRPERDLERVVREATSAGAVVVVARRGSNPARVTWSDGSVSFHYEDPDRYRDAQERGIAPQGRSSIGPPPPIGSPRPPT